MKKQKVALVLSSGGARGLGHIGVIEELESRGYEISSVAGTSIGAVIGGSYAAGELSAYKEWVTSLTKMEVFKLMDFTLSKNGLMKGEKVFEEMKKRIPEQNIEDLEIPFTALAVDLISKKEVVFNEGSLYEAIRASVSIPTVFIPYELENMKLVDGGLLNPIPMRHIKRNENDIVVAVNLNAPDNTESANIQAYTTETKLEDSAYSRFFQKYRKIISKSQRQKLSYFNIINTMFDIMLIQICQYELEVRKPDVLISLPQTLTSTFEFYRAGEIIEYGRTEAGKALDNFEKSI
jgi:NTE family protein